MQSAVLVAAVGILAAIAYGDVRMRLIPNALSLAIAALGLMRIVLADDAMAALHTLVLAAVIFCGAFALFRLGAIGGGDAKLTPATALLIGNHGLVDFLLLMSFCGGGLALAVLARDRLRVPRRRRRRAIGAPAPARSAESAAAPLESSVPYGVAIAVAGIITLVFAR